MYLMEKNKAGKVAKEGVVKEGLAKRWYLSKDVEGGVRRLDLWRKSGPGKEVAGHRPCGRTVLSTVGWPEWNTEMERRKGTKAERTGVCWPPAGLVFIQVRWDLLGVLN